MDQLTKFDRALRDFSGASGEARGIDGMLVTKWDTVDDKVVNIFVASDVLLKLHSRLVQLCR